MIVDDVIPYACPGTQDAPLLGNLGAAMIDAYGDDLLMAALFGGQQRTVGEFGEIVAEAGWKIEAVYPTVGTAVCQVVCVKI